MMMIFFIIIILQYLVDILNFCLHLLDNLGKTVLIFLIFQCKVEASERCSLPRHCASFSQSSSRARVDTRKPCRYIYVYICIILFQGYFCCFLL